LEVLDETRKSLPSSIDKLGSRIKVVSDLIGDRSDAAQAAGVSVASLQRYLAGAIPPFDVAAGLAFKAGINLQWLATGAGPMHISDSVCEPSAIDQAGEPPPHPDEYAYIPLYNVEASAGYGSYVDSVEIASRLAFRREWLHQEVHANPAHLHLIYVRGDSMEPALQSGEVVMVDASTSNEPVRDGIHVIQIDGSVLIKRLQRLPGNRVKVTSDNKIYAPFEADLNTAEITIIGRIIWHAGRI